MQRKAASGTLVPEDHRKLEEDPGTEAEMLSTEDSGTHDSIIEATWLQHHDSNNEEAHDMERSNGRLADSGERCVQQRGYCSAGRGRCHCFGRP